MMILMSVLHSASLSPVRCSTHFVHDEALENSIFEKLLATAEFSCFMMTWMSVVHSVSSALYRHKTHFLD